MSQPSHSTSSPGRLLVLDSSGPARWILATWRPETDTTPAQMEPGGRRYSGPAWIAATQWVRHQLGVTEIRLVPVTMTVWRVDEELGRW